MQLGAARRGAEAERALALYEKLVEECAKQPGASSAVQGYKFKALLLRLAAQPRELDLFRQAVERYDTEVSGVLYQSRVRFLQNVARCCEARDFAELAANVATYQELYGLSAGERKLLADLQPSLQEAQ